MKLLDCKICSQSEHIFVKILNSDITVFFHETVDYRVQFLESEKIQTFLV